MGTIMIFLRMRGPGADGARREPARMAAGALRLHFEMDMAFAARGA